MRPQELIVRCYAEKKGDTWQAVCIDLNLAAQSHSLEHARKKLNSQIAEYVYDAVAGEDQEYAAELLSRKAPLSLRLKYHRIKTIHQVMRLKDGCLFNLPMPLIPTRA